MPDESCRSCGGELANQILCSGCRKAIQKKCKVCNRVTHRQSHNYCMKISSSNQKPSLVQVIQKNKVTKNNKNSFHLSLLVSGVVGFFILGFITASYTGIPQGIPDEAQATNSNNVLVKIKDNSPAEYGRSYDNCLAYGSGESITITCPTDNGSVYKGILNMPKDLAKEFSGSVFSIRGLSIKENSGGSVILQYHLKTYQTNFFGN